MIGIIGKIKNFVSEVAKEMKKVSWPSREQLKESTIVVIVTTMVFTAFVFGIDNIFRIVFKGMLDILV